MVRVVSDKPFLASLAVITVTYVALLLAMLVADVAYMVDSGEEFLAEQQAAGTLVAEATDDPRDTRLPVFLIPVLQALRQPEIQYSVKLTLISCLFTAILSILVAVPVGYLLSRHQFRGKAFLDAVLDIPIVLPPLIVGLSLLILFRYMPFRPLRPYVVYQIPAVVLAQFTVAAAFAVRVMRSTFEQIDPRVEQVALTLGCSRAQAFAAVVLPQAIPGMLTAGTLAWARAMGEFGPLLIFAGATRFKTEVLSTTVFLELSVGRLDAAVAVSLIMVFAAVIVLIIARVWGARHLVNAHR